MTTSWIFRHELSRLVRLLEQVGTGVVVAGFAAAGVKFWVSALSMLSRLEQIGLPQLAGGLAGI